MRSFLVPAKAMSLPEFAATPEGSLNSPSNNTRGPERAVLAHFRPHAEGERSGYEAARRSGGEQRALLNVTISARLSRMGAQLADAVSQCQGQWAGIAWKSNAAVRRHPGMRARALGLWQVRWWKERWENSKSVLPGIAPFVLGRGA